MSPLSASNAKKPFAFAPRRGLYADATELLRSGAPPLDDQDVARFESLDALYRALCAILYNYVPMSGHPGGSISSGRFAACLLFDSLHCDLSKPGREEADLVCYAAGHKAMGLYALWALRDEIARLGAPELLPRDPKERLRLEDLLGFRRNAETASPLFLKLGAKALDGHPTPATPFVRAATGASGVGMASSLGLALAAKDVYGAAAPFVHVIEGEGGLTPGRVAEALAAAGTAALSNAVVHVDWNQSSIDSDRVCREGDKPGDYVQWNPLELFHLHDWNVVFVPDGSDFRQIAAAQRWAASAGNGQPTAVVYRTVKGRRYGIEGRASHGAGHKLCSEGFAQAVSELGAALPACDAKSRRCEAAGGAEELERCFWQALRAVRGALEADDGLYRALAARLAASRDRLETLGRKPRADAPRVEALYAAAAKGPERPPELALEPGAVTTLRGELGRALNHLNKASGGAILAAAADLLGSTSANLIGSGFGEGFWNASENRRSRLLSIGGICEDAMAGMLSGVSAFGRHVGAGSSYGAFLAPLGHIAARLHAIGAQAKASVDGKPYRPFVLICAHAGLKTGEDGPTHADPQCLQLLQDNFPLGTAVTLTPWDPAEIWPLVAAAFTRRPAVIAPFVTRPNETVLDRAALGLAPAEAAAEGLYVLRRPKGEGEGTIVLQESAAAYEFVQRALPLLEKEGLDPWVYYVASSELFDLLPEERRREIFPEVRAREAMGVTGFTLPTMTRWVRGALGLAMTLHPFRGGRFLGSGQGSAVLAEAGLDGESQFLAIKRYVEALRSR